MPPADGTPTIDELAELVAPVIEDHSFYERARARAAAATRPPKFAEALVRDYDLHRAVTVDEADVRAATVAAEEAHSEERYWQKEGVQAAPPAVSSAEAPDNAKAPAPPASGSPQGPPSEISRPPKLAGEPSSDGSLVILARRLDQLEGNLSVGIAEVKGMVNGLSMRVAAAQRSEEEGSTAASAPSLRAFDGERSLTIEGRRLQRDAVATNGTTRPSSTAPRPTDQPMGSFDGADVEAPAQEQGRPLRWLWLGGFAAAGLVGLGLLVSRRGSVEASVRGPEDLVILQTGGYGAYVREEQTALAALETSGASPEVRARAAEAQTVLAKISGIRPLTQGSGSADTSDTQMTR